MKNNIIFILFIICFLLVIEAKETVKEEITAKTLTGNFQFQKEASHNQQIIEEITAQHNKVKLQLIKNLSLAISQYSEDYNYYSPLHASILAIGEWRVSEVEDTLINLVDYKIDASSIPLGFSYMKDYLYPSVGALVEIRVDSIKIVEAIAKSKNTTRIQLLTWILDKRLCYTERVRELLISSRDKYKNSFEQKKSEHCPRMA